MSTFELIFSEIAEIKRRLDRFATPAVDAEQWVYREDVEHSAQRAEEAEQKAAMLRAENEALRKELAAYRREAAKLPPNPTPAFNVTINHHGGTLNPEDVVKALRDMERQGRA